MVTSIEQATRIQQKRVAAGKLGHSKAVRRFLKRGKNFDNISDWEDYLTLKLELPHLGNFPHHLNKETICHSNIY